MDVAQIRALKPRLDNYLAGFEDCFSRCDTREHLAVYVRGQLSDLAQKSVEPMALAAGIPPRTLQEFLARYKWNENTRRCGIKSGCVTGSRTARRGRWFGRPSPL
jgi:SRSO17 transposase